jgi:glycine/sarcosine/betaine reductase complex component A
MDPENQDRIKSLVEKLGRDDVLVVLGAADPEALEVAAETVTAGDPSYVGPLAGVSLGLHVMHIFEDELKALIDPAVYQEQIGLLELALDTDAVKETMRRTRGDAPIA